ncbi:LysR family transcriptional regulator [Paraburkholderia sp. BCC1885]|uniref:helix-turn-helix domain-containing protein n=1 Tax=Paraburkholderia sp. BCC1885 TaxID=2562669 RepID=UPI00391F9ECD
MSFAAVARNRSFAAAARELGLAPSSAAKAWRVSKAISACGCLIAPRALSV